MSNDRKREILELLENGQISADEAAQMLSADPEAQTAGDQAPEATDVPLGEESNKSGDGPSMFRVRVRNMKTGENKVSVNIPVRMLKFGLKLGSRFSPELEGLDLNEINGLVTDMESGMLVEVQNDENNEHVQVYIE